MNASDTRTRPQVLVRPTRGPGWLVVTGVTLTVMTGVLLTATEGDTRLVQPAAALRNAAEPDVTATVTTDQLNVRTVPHGATAVDMSPSAVFATLPRNSQVSVSCAFTATPAGGRFYRISSLSLPASPPDADPAASATYLTVAGKRTVPPCATAGGEHATGQPQVVNATIAAKVNLGLRDGPNYEFRETARIPTATPVTIQCWVDNSPADVEGVTGRSPTWDRITVNGRTGYVPDTFLTLPGRPVKSAAPRCGNAPHYPPEGQQHWENESALTGSSLTAACLAAAWGPQACGNLKNSTRDAFRIAWQIYRFERSPDELLDGQEDQRDALRHCVWQGLLTVRNNHDDLMAHNIGDLHEKQTAKSAADLGSSSTKMDLWNNKVARDYARNKNVTETQMVDFCIDRAKNAVQFDDAVMKTLPVTIDTGGPQNSPVTSPSFPGSDQANNYLVFSKTRPDNPIHGRDDDWAKDQAVPTK